MLLVNHLFRTEILQSNKHKKKLHYGMQLKNNQMPFYNNKGLCQSLIIPHTGCPLIHMRVVHFFRKF